MEKEEGDVVQPVNNDSKQYAKGEACAEKPVQQDIRLHDNTDQLPHKFDTSVIEISSKKNTSSSDHSTCVSQKSSDNKFSPSDHVTQTPPNKQLDISDLFLLQNVRDSKYYLVSREDYHNLEREGLSQGLSPISFNSNSSDSDGDVTDDSGYIIDYGALPKMARFISPGNVNSNYLDNRTLHTAYASEINAQSPLNSQLNPGCDHLNPGVGVQQSDYGYDPDYQLNPHVIPWAHTQYPLNRYEDEYLGHYDDYRGQEDINDEMRPDTVVGDYGPYSSNMTSRPVYKRMYKEQEDIDAEIQSPQGTFDYDFSPRATSPRPQSKELNYGHIPLKRPKYDDILSTKRMDINSTHAINTAGNSEQINNPEIFYRGNLLSIENNDNPTLCRTTAYTAYSDMQSSVNTYDKNQHTADITCGTMVDINTTINDSSNVSVTSWNKMEVIESNAILQARAEQFACSVKPDYKGISDANTDEYNFDKEGLYLNSDTIELYKTTKVENSASGSDTISYRFDDKSQQHAVASGYADLVHGSGEMELPLHDPGVEHHLVKRESQVQYAADLAAQHLRSCTSTYGASGRSINIHTERFVTAYEGGDARNKNVAINPKDGSIAIVIPKGVENIARNNAIKRKEKEEISVTTKVVNGNSDIDLKNHQNDAMKVKNELNVDSKTAVDSSAVINAIVVEAKQDDKVNDVPNDVQKQETKDDKKDNKELKVNSVSVNDVINSDAKQKKVTKKDSLDDHKDDKKLESNDEKLMKMSKIVPDVSNKSGHQIGTNDIGQINGDDNVNVTNITVTKTSGDAAVSTSSGASDAKEMNSDSVSKDVGSTETDKMDTSTRKDQSKVLNDASIDVVTKESVETVASIPPSKPDTESGDLTTLHSTEVITKDTSDTVASVSTTSGASDAKDRKSDSATLSNDVVSKDTDKIDTSTEKDQSVVLNDESIDVFTKESVETVTSIQPSKPDTKSDDSNSLHSTEVITKDTSDTVASVSTTLGASDAKDGKSDSTTISNDVVSKKTDKMDTSTKQDQSTVLNDESIDVFTKESVETVTSIQPSKPDTKSEDSTKLHSTEVITKETADTVASGSISTDANKSEDVIITDTVDVRDEPMDVSNSANAEEVSSESQDTGQINTPTDITVEEESNTSDVSLKNKGKSDYRSSNIMEVDNGTVDSSLTSKSVSNKASDDLVMQNAKNASDDSKKPIGKSDLDAVQKDSEYDYKNEELSNNSDVKISKESINGSDVQINGTIDSEEVITQQSYTMDVSEVPLVSAIHIKDSEIKSKKEKKQKGNSNKEDKKTDNLPNDDGPSSDLSINSTGAGFGVSESLITYKIPVGSEKDLQSSKTKNDSDVVIESNDITTNTNITRTNITFESSPLNSDTKDVKGNEKEVANDDKEDELRMLDDYSSLINDISSSIEPERHSFTMSEESEIDDALRELDFVIDSAEEDIEDGTKESKAPMIEEEIQKIDSDVVHAAPPIKEKGDDLDGIPDDIVLSKKGRVKRKKKIPSHDHNISSNDETSTDEKDSKSTSINAAKDLNFTDDIPTEDSIYVSAKGRVKKRKTKAIPKDDISVSTDDKNDSFSKYGNISKYDSVDNSFEAKNKKHDSDIRIKDSESDITIDNITPKTINKSYKNVERNIHSQADNTFEKMDTNYKSEKISNWDMVNSPDSSDILDNSDSTSDNSPSSRFPCSENDIYSSGDDKRKSYAQAVKSATYGDLPSAIEKYGHVSLSSSRVRSKRRTKHEPERKRASSVEVEFKRESKPRSERIPSVYPSSRKNEEAEQAQSVTRRFDVETKFSALSMMNDEGERRKLFSGQKARRRSRGGKKSPLKDSEVIVSEKIQTESSQPLLNTKPKEEDVKKNQQHEENSPKIKEKKNRRNGNKENDSKKEVIESKENRKKGKSKAQGVLKDEINEAKSSLSTTTTALTKQSSGNMCCYILLAIFIVIVASIYLSYRKYMNDE